MITIKNYFILIFFTLLEFTSSTFATEGLLKPSDDIVTKSAVLNLQYEGYAGVLPYIRDAKGKTYVILSREAGGAHTGRYCEFGGGVDFNNATGRPYRLISTAKEELRQESSKLLDLSEEYIVNNSYFFYDAKPMTAKLMAYMPLERDHYFSANEFLAARNKLSSEKAEWHYIEKDDFQWVSISSLAKAVASNEWQNIRVDVLPADLKNPWDIDTADITQSKIISLRPFFIYCLNGIKEPLKSMSATCQEILG